MRKVENINLGGIPFIINYDAYEKLENYLDAVRSQFSDSSGQEEIMQDIEIRMAEIFNEKLQSKKIVDMNILDEAISMMGTPDQFDMDSSYDTSSEESSGSKQDHKQKKSSKSKRSFTSEGEYSVGKKLFRDPENEMIAGVCSGLSAYFGISDPIWMRILFVILLIGGFSGGIIYIILWILMPEAKTSSDRLAMKGKDINISSIATSVEEELNELGKKFDKMSSDWK